MPVGAGGTYGLWWQRAQGKEAFGVLVRLRNTRSSLTFPGESAQRERPCGVAMPRGNTACPEFSPAFICMRWVKHIPTNNPTFSWVGKKNSKTV